MRSIVKCLFLALLLTAVAGVHRADAVNIGTAFSYQGQLDKNGAPYTGAADMKFRLYADSTGAQVGSEFTATGVPVDDGLFTVRLDFGNVWTGQALWLQTDVQTPGDAGYTSLTPRTAILAVPYAVRALNGPAGSSQWSNSANGIEYNAGNVAIGETQAHGGVKLYVNTGTTSVNPVRIVSNDASHAAFWVQNNATNGIGIYDDQSDRHYLAGSLGINVPSPTAMLDVSATGRGIHVKADGSVLAGPAAIIAEGKDMPPPLFGFDAMGVWASSVSNRAVAGFSTNSWGVSGDCTSAGTYGVLGTPSEGIYGHSPSASKPAGRFTNTASGGVALEANGLAKVKTLQILGGSDLAEPFDVAAVDGAVEPGDVVVIDEASPGDLRVSDAAYDSRVAGVISGANDLSPGMIMKSEHDAHADGAHPVALTGRVWCKVDASYGPVQPGDLLTTSDTPGHAMNATDASRRAGAVIGKAMTSLEAGRGLVLVLVNLQ